MSISPALITAEEFARLPNLGRPCELIQGQIVMMNLPSPRHGEICLQIAYLLKTYLDKHPIGRVSGNDGAVIVARDPDSVRGADVAYYSHQRVAPGPLPAGYLTAVPELVFEVLSPSDRWPDAEDKVADYLTAGVTVVCVVDPEEETAHLFRAEQPRQQLAACDLLELPDILPGFQVRVGRYLE